MTILFEDEYSHLPTAQQRYRARHREELKQKTKEYYRRTREERLAYYRKWREANRELHREYHHKLMREIKELLGNKCVKCGFSDTRALQIDHLNGGGSKFRKNVRGRRYYKNILDAILAGSKEYQLLCANCNVIKRYERGENA